MTDNSFTSKLPSVGTTIFTVMSALATEQNAINLGQGFPDYQMPESLIDAVAKAMKDGFNQYSPMQGYLPLRESLSSKIKRLYGMDINPADEITITPGATYALYTAMTCLLQPGDEVIVLEPAYDSYIPGILLNGGIPIRLSLELPTYRIDWEKVRSAITKKTRLIIINNPHNPTGTILNKTDIDELREIVNNSPIYLLSDEVYEHLVYDGKQHESILKYADLYAKSFVCFSFGKLYHSTGWKIGYCVAPPSLTREFRKVHQFNAFSTHTPSQVGLASIVRDESSYDTLAAELQEKRDLFADLLSVTRLKALICEGTYFQCYTYEEVSNEPAAEFCIRLTKEAGVAAIPLSAFYEEKTDAKVIRFCFAKKEETLLAAANRLKRYFQK